MEFYKALQGARVPSLAVLLLFLGGCFGGGDEVTCDRKDDSFLRNSLIHYFEKKGESEKIPRLKIDSKAQYSKNTNWWVVAFTLDGELYNALISCDGQLELTKPNPN